MKKFCDWGVIIDRNSRNSRNSKVESRRSNLILFGAENCHFLNVTSTNSPYVGLMMRGNGGKKNTIEGFLVDNNGCIGIQI